MINLPVDDERNGKTYLGILDYSWLFSYAIAMFFRYVCVCGTHSNLATPGNLASNIAMVSNVVAPGL